MSIVACWSSGLPGIPPAVHKILVDKQQQEGQIGTKAIPGNDDNIKIGLNDSIDLQRNLFISRK